MFNQTNAAQLYDNLTDDIVDILIEGKADIEIVNQIDLNNIPEMGLGRSTLAAIVLEIGNRVIAQYKANSGGSPETTEGKNEFQQLEVFLSSGSALPPVIGKVRQKLAETEG